MFVNRKLQKIIRKLMGSDVGAAVTLALMSGGVAAGIIGGFTLMNTRDDLTAIGGFMIAISSVYVLGVFALNSILSISSED